MHDKTTLINELENTVKKLKDEMKESSSGAIAQQLSQSKRQLPTSINRIKFMIQPEIFTANTKVYIYDFINAKQLHDVWITQVSININDATTVHKLQGCSNDKLIVWPWTKKLKHWVYVILSRVQILLGLYFFRTI